VQVNNERDVACLDREVRVDPMEGALIRSVSVRPKPAAGPAGLVRRTFEARDGARSLGDVARQRASEVRTSGQASSADGRRRSAAAGDPQRVIPMPRRDGAS